MLSGDHHGCKAAWLCTIWLLAAFTGCGQDSPPANRAGSNEVAGNSPRRNVKPPARVASETKPNAPDAATSADWPTPSPRPGDTRPSPQDRRSLADLVDTEDSGEPEPAATPYSFARVDDPAGRSWQLDIDDTKAAVAGIRRLQGNHLTLYTDVPQNPAVDELPHVFDLAVAEWCRYFHVDLGELLDWQITGFLMQNRLRFQGAGMLPADLPPFQNGFQRGHYVWAFDQEDDYYRRHLLLHEGTHAFMDQILGTIGPPWYAEGMAELLGTHRWVDGRLTLGYSPKDRTESEGWGRVKIIRDELAADHGMMPEKIMNYGPQAHLRNAPYGWCWGLCTFLDTHPLSQAAFRRLPEHLRSGDVTPWFRRQIDEHWAELNEDWQVFVMGVEYGYDVARAAIVRRPGEPLPAAGTTATITADRGWQSTGVRLAAGSRYEIVAAGRYQVAETTQPWECEPGGITIHYYRGHPLGMLMAAVRNDAQPLAGLSPLTKPEPVGLQTVLNSPHAGTLYLKINESPADLADNQGQITIRIQKAGEVGPGG